MKISFFIGGTPQGKAVVRRGPRGVFFTDKKSRDYMEAIRKIARESYPGEKMGGAVTLEIVAYFKPPASTSKRVVANLLGKPFMSRPDADNISKGICDALSPRKGDEWGIWDNDSQVFKLTVTKLYDENEGVRVNIENESMSK